MNPALKQPKTSPLERRLARGAFWSLAGTAIFRGCAFLSSILAARLLGKADFGALGIIQSTVGMFSSLAGFGLGLTATTYVAQYRARDPERAGRVLALSSLTSWATGSVGAVLLLLLAPWLAEHTLAAPRIAGELGLSAVLILFGAVAGAQTGALAGFESFRRIALVNFWCGLANVPLVYAGCRFFGLGGAVAGMAAAQGLGCILNRWALAEAAAVNHVPVQVHDWMNELPILWKFSFPAVLGSLVCFTARWCGGAMIVREPGGLQQMAVCSVGTQFQTLVLFLPGLVAQAATPILAELYRKGDSRSFRSFLSKNLVLNAGISVCTCLPLMFFASTLLKFYGQGYAQDVRIILLFLFAAVLASVSNLAMQTLATQGAMLMSLLNNLAWSALLVMVIGISPGRNAVTVALANIVAYGFYLCFSLCWVWVAADPTASVCGRARPGASPRVDAASEEPTSPVSSV